MSMSKVIEEIRRNPSVRYMQEPVERLKDERCIFCNRLLGKFNGQAEIKCPKCGKINRIGVKRA
nr:MAG TPA: hypothetical protein [Bacteriophage sp.]